MVLAHTGENVLSCLQLRDGDVDKRGCEREQGDALMGEGGQSKQMGCSRQQEAFL